ncbi:phage tail protein [Pasteurellaceae bacterium USgator11]|nr:phage tail protein [Pasteurellaceae bacterium USgator41]TNG95761.1 phage tail protein [Pasteurellaceae bacterium UScroc12]TNG98819.1 phage tail protein [Pasteurellaceae bacterium USgator11]TNG99202.1 phage tail protein [Pasteurellaceae bacterium UScroc31]
MSNSLEKEILQYAKEQEPREMCGFVVFKGKEKQFIQCENIASEPERYFEIHPDDWLKAQLYDGIVALVHSHPDGKPILSAADRQMQVNSASDWWLVCDGEIRKFRNMPRLLGREFKHGELDCYTLFRDAYLLSGADLPDFDRVDMWWHENKNLYLDNMEKHGFERVGDPQVGDVILMQVGAEVPNHAAVYLGNNFVLHHSPNRLSKRDLYDGYWLKHTHSIWRYKKWSELDFTGILNDLESDLI